MKSLHKGGPVTNLGNKRPIIPTSVICEFMEYTISDLISYDITNLIKIDPHQFGEILLTLFSYPWESHTSQHHGIEGWGEQGSVRGLGICGTDGEDGHACVWVHKVIGASWWRLRSQLQSAVCRVGKVVWQRSACRSVEQISAVHLLHIPLRLYLCTLGWEYG